MNYIKNMYRTHNGSAAALILRLTLAVIFIDEGWSKITNVAGTSHFFAMIGLTSMAWVYLVGYVEFFGGILLAGGFLTKPVCVALAIDMAVIIWGLPMPKGGLFWGHSYEFLIMMTLLAIYALGPGKYSLAHLYLKGRKS